MWDWPSGALVAGRESELGLLASRKWEQVSQTLSSYISCIAGAGGSEGWEPRSLQEAGAAGAVWGTTREPGGRVRWVWRWAGEADRSFPRMAGARSSLIRGTSVGVQSAAIHALTAKKPQRRERAGGLVASQAKKWDCRLPAARCSSSILRGAQVAKPHDTAAASVREEHS